MKKKTNYTILLTAILIIVTIALLGFYYYQTNYGPLPYEEGYDEIYAEQGMPGIDYEYTGPNTQNLLNPTPIPSN